MKRLSDYRDEEALELWADIMEPLGVIFADKEISELAKKNTSVIKIASRILKHHSKEAKEILLRIDSTPLNGMNIVIRLANLVSEFMNTEVTGDFFESQAQNKIVEFSGSVTENTEGEEN